jgi:Na+/H+-dicarboxylate symporter
MARLKKLQLSTQMAIAMIAGSILGIIVGPPIQHIQFIGDIWLNLLKMVIVPMVIFVVVKGISTMDSPKTLVTCPGDYVSSDPTLRVGVGPAERAG